MEHRIGNPKWRSVILRVLELLWDRYGTEQTAVESWNRIYGLLS